MQVIRAHHKSYQTNISVLADQSEKYGKREKHALKRAAKELHYDVRNPHILEELDNAQTIGEATRIMIEARKKEKDSWGLNKK